MPCVASIGCLVSSAACAIILLITLSELEVMAAEEPLKGDLVADLLVANGPNDCTRESRNSPPVAAVSHSNSSLSTEVEGMRLHDASLITSARSTLLLGLELRIRLGAS